MRFQQVEVASQELALARLAEQTKRTMSAPIVRQTVLSILSDCPSRDDMCELEAIFNAIKHGDSRVEGLRNGFKYVADPKHLDYFVAPNRNLEWCLDGACGGDCLPYDTLVLRQDGHIVPLAEIVIGDVIMGDGVWTKVTNRWDKGEKDLIAITLNNGATLRVTPDHRLFRVPKIDGYAGDRAAAEEVRAGDVQPGDDLLTPENLPFGNRAMDTDRAWLLGTYIADGWSDQPSRACIAGKDGHPKEAQKQRIKDMAAHFGWPTRWHERYIAINDAQVASWLSACGARAPQKHIPDGLTLTEDAVRAVLTGLLADASIGKSIVHGTTSALLAIQLRVLYRMIGQSVHIRRVDDHGGLGTNPIYRITVRAAADERDDGMTVRKFARVKAITEIGCEPVMDIETDSHRFYLPESDLIVHNCDDHAALICALAGMAGFSVGMRIWGPNPGLNEFSHVYAVVGYPKKGGRGAKILGMDTTVDSSKVGWEPPKGRVKTAWIVPLRAG